MASTSRNQSNLNQVFNNSVTLGPPQALGNNASPQWSSGVLNQTVRSPFGPSPNWDMAYDVYNQPISMKLPDDTISGFEVSYQLEDKTTGVIIVFTARKTLSKKESLENDTMYFFPSGPEYDDKVPVFNYKYEFKPSEAEAVKRGDQKIIGDIVKFCLTTLKETIIDWKVDNDEECQSLKRMIDMVGQGIF